MKAGMKRTRNRRNSRAKERGCIEIDKRILFISTLGFDSTMLTTELSAVISPAAWKSVLGYERLLRGFNRSSGVVRYRKIIDVIIARYPAAKGRRGFSIYIRVILHDCDAKHLCRRQQKHK
jgi:hypothetical protein